MKRSILVLAAFAICSWSTAVLAQGEQEAGQAGAMLNDAETVKVLMTINEGEIQAAQMAQQKQVKQEVSEYAKTLLEDHRENLEKTQQVASKAKITPAESSTSQQLKSSSSEQLSALGRLQGQEFERQFLQTMLMQHNQALMIVDRQMQTVKNDKLKSHLRQTREVLASHRDKARELMQKSSPTKGGSSY